MTIKKGQEWGIPGVLAPDAVVAATDAEAARFVGQNATIGLDGGDLARTLGVRHPFDRSGPKQLLQIDAVGVELDDGSSQVAVAHVVVGRMHISSRVVAVMNASFLGALNIAPRAHPGDGKIDEVTIELPWLDRIKARKRMPSGTHVPHPGITIRRKTSGSIEFNRPQLVRVDGVLAGRSQTLRFDLMPAALTIAV